VILGSGVAGSSAVDAAVGLQARVTAVDRNPKRLDALANRFGNRVQTRYSTAPTIERLVAEADLVIGSVLIPGAESPKVLTKEMVSRMHTGAVLVDLSIDQGGCFETSRPTTHADPTYTVDGVIHYCVANVPGAVPGTSTIALENAILPYVKTLAEGWREAVRSNRHLANGLNIDAGAVLHPVVAEATRRQLQTFSEIRSGGPA
jgi:alanine dehydrogenase